MRKIQNIPIQSIVSNKPALDKKTLEIAKYLEKGGSLPPIKVQKDQYGSFKLKNGRHRLTAHKLLDKTEILAVFYTE